MKNRPDHVESHIRRMCERERERCTDHTYLQSHGVKLVKEGKAPNYARLFEESSRSPQAFLYPVV
ncbi:hypothetical protein HBI56_026370 [Parastagonospora nodorum]|uniref:Uncharacterized protein n=1 Tax=Phaeosphaeria nodorum (strain SN15 / ATCC MYA-4574 / FGSC 10173) TaxID=321614 RepID=A0A7U2EZR0_PHANO|nr:hypothetical protein HBH56_014030 [Parastagonospora nodorum]QRC94908.1 hypothetical protein JI435_406490 [Parastagonospora nodorum SN15]KAH3937134.1 hypothetical protein HBH54_020420 [Parastagonospora nodorum]KAH3953750.1 hypothetical protein HBH53_032820 [Parastagonospora nodorum]KAH3969314.1 hypothetical protein HBH51_124980 [Parastagonospora nodorum]